MAVNAALPHRKLWIGIGVGFVLLVIYLSLNTHPIYLVTPWNFKLGHVLAYCWLSFWFLQIFRRLSIGITIALALCLLGVALEYVQRMTGYRHFAYTDMRDNAIGVAIGMLLAMTPLGRLLWWIDTRLSGGP